MSPENFAYWCQGFVELTGGAHPTPEQWKMIKEHLGLVFTKVTPPLTTPKVEPSYCSSMIGSEGVGPSSANWPAGPLTGEFPDGATGGYRFYNPPHQPYASIHTTTC
jgi:hypothetical protein